MYQNWGFGLKINHLATLTRHTNDGIPSDDVTTSEVKVI
jgi:hypothetical protein